MREVEIQFISVTHKWRPILFQASIKDYCKLRRDCLKLVDVVLATRIKRFIYDGHSLFFCDKIRATIKP
uniref:AlNc14C105G6166 protein n=1 Tax=Albugo laibachii Nc14 TaxID=890382 RepID=F0WHV9_9STRA|nr:AlNc14C105G6166 [Albugo laibachii Nc14]|eukprot:CCA20834.1 AlNc14C105G6166 [Albugo laibachii Nc14]